MRRFFVAMPYHLSKDKLSVLDDAGKVVKKHASKAKAKAHLIALNINVSKSELAKKIPKKKAESILAELFDEYAMAEIDSDDGYDYWQIPYTLSGEDVTISDRIDWTQVEPKQTWVEASEARRIEHAK